MQVIVRFSSLLLVVSMLLLELRENLCELSARATCPTALHSYKAGSADYDIHQQKTKATGELQDDKTMLMEQIIQVSRTPFCIEGHQ